MSLWNLSGKKKSLLFKFYKNGSDWKAGLRKRSCQNNFSNHFSQHKTISRKFRSNPLDAPNQDRTLTKVYSKGNKCKQATSSLKIDKSKKQWSEADCYILEWKGHQSTQILQESALKLFWNRLSHISSPNLLKFASSPNASVKIIFWH